jgi:hypothetical protein
MLPALAAVETSINGVVAPNQKNSFQSRLYY